MRQRRHIDAQVLALVSLERGTVFALVRDVRVISSSPLALVLVAASTFGLISCGGTSAARIADVRTTPSIGTTVLASARMIAPATRPDIIRSCAGARLCREDSLTSAEPEALADVEAACARTGGNFGPGRCPRAEAAASCAGAGEYGSLAVYVYARGDELAGVVGRLSEQCEALGGTFETLDSTLTAR